MAAEDFDVLNNIGSIEASGWCNLWFLRGGRSYLGLVRLRSEDAATAMGIRRTCPELSLPPTHSKIATVRSARIADARPKP
jgi:hypothetical protein